MSICYMFDHKKGEQVMETWEKKGDDILMVGLKDSER